MTINHHEISAQKFNLAYSLKPRLLGTKYFPCDQLAIKFMPVLVIYFFPPKYDAYVILLVVGESLKLGGPRSVKMFFSCFNYHH